jgi:hypothetical protein
MHVCKNARRLNFCTLTFLDKKKGNV